MAEANGSKILTPNEFAVAKQEIDQPLGEKMTHYLLFQDGNTYSLETDRETVLTVLEGNKNATTLVSSNTPTPTATPIPDTIPPAATITFPLNNSTVTRNSNVVITAVASDNMGVAKVEFYVNGALKCTDASDPYSCTWKVPAKRGVVYTIAAKAYDAAGNSSTNSVKVTSK